ncbi:MAG TPA: DUF2568 domain-containing protein [Mycobacteriales bacterium]|nr:DUF2568 domain-containing protein [Mycobacteriales bacterium]
MFAALRFLSELALLAALTVTGAEAADGWPAIALAIAFPAAAASLWGRVVASKSRHRLADPARAAGEATIFAGAVAGLWLVGHPAWAGALAVVAAVAAVGVRRRT